MDANENGFEVVIIGGGAAGMSAALWCDELGLTSMLIEQEGQLGGQLHSIHNPIENYLGASAPNGAAMLTRFDNSIASRNFVRRMGIKAVSIQPDDKTVDLDAGGDRIETVSFKTLIVATGVSRRSLGVPGEREFFGRGVLESGAKEKESVSGKRVVIVGGGDAAFENAMILSEFAESVKVAFRKPEPSARGEFVQAVSERDNVELMPETKLHEIAGGSQVENVVLETPDGDRREIQTDHVLIRIGVEPNSDIVADMLRLDDRGYIWVDESGRSSISHVYAVGDVAHPNSPTLSTAAGTAATSVKAIFHTSRNAKEL